MKVVDFLKNMTKKQKIILIIILILIVIGILSIAIVRNKSKENLKKSDYEKEYEEELEAAEAEDVPILQESEDVSEEELEKEEVKGDTSTGKAKYYIKVNYRANVVTVYGKDDDEKYTVPVKAMICSTGKATPKSGVYKTTKGYKWGALFGGVYGQYSTRIVGSILFHSVPYTAKRNDTLEYWEFDKLGTSASAGCVRLMVEDAKWIFNNCEAGTMVEFYADSNPGPLGKPSAPKISGNERCRNWDPTDTVSGNPWFSDEDQNVQNNITNNTNEEVNSSETNVNTNNSEIIITPEDVPMGE